MKILIRFLLIFTLLTPSFAYAVYDWQTGNTYNSYQDGSGNTQVNGFNINTGGSWQTTINPNGNMQGRDANGNNWDYNDSTGYYHNYGTGKTCIGKGNFRQCY